MLEFTTNLYV